MRITTVSVRRLKSLQLYSNIQIGAEAEIQDGDDPDKVRIELDLWVQFQLDGAKSVDELQSSISDLKWYVERLTDERDRLKEEITMLEQKAMDLKPKRDEMPF
jgi:predicted nuclease with TOPRIM domain